MKFLCDVHISFKVCKALELAGYRCIHVNNILQGSESSDNSIAKYADKENMILITKDGDFRNSFLLKNLPKFLVKINLGNITNEVLITVLLSNVAKIENAYSNRQPFMLELGSGNFVNLTN